MADLAAQQSLVTGLTLNMPAASAGGDTVPGDGRTALLVRNGSGSSINVTAVVPGTKYGQPIADIVVTVAAGATALIGPFPSDVNNTTTGKVDITYSAVTTVTVAAVQI